MAPTATASATATSTLLSQQLLAKTTPQTPPTFSFTPFLQRTYLHSLPADRPVCRAYTNGHCPLGTRCPDRHVSSATSSAAKQDGGFGHAFNSLVCKHWLRGLCKKGESCEFLHEFNLRKMPECNFFLRNGFCSNGDECLYLHIDPQSKLPPCPHYDMGFCPLGPRCAKKHVRKKMCPYFLAGFCPAGPECKDGAHPKWKKDLEKPTVKVEKKDDEDGTPARKDFFDDEDEGSLRDRGGDRDRDRDRERDRGHERGGHQGRYGGRGGRWRGRGGRRGGRH